MSVKEFVIDYLQREYTIPDDIDILALNYVEAGYIDSMAFIQFMALLEDEFGFFFEDEELLNKELFVVGKLIETVEGKI